MHFVGDGVGFLRRVLVIVFLIVFLIIFLIAFLISFVIGVQRFLQLFEFGGLDKRFGHRFDRLGALFGIGLRFFVLGLGQLFGERGYFFLGEACAIRSMRVRDHLRASDSSFGSRAISVSIRRSGDSGRAGGRFGRALPQRELRALQESRPAGVA